MDISFCDYCALNEDGTEAAFNDDDDGLRIMEVSKGVGYNGEPTIVSVEVPESLKEIAKLAYSNGNVLHVLHKGGSVSLVDPSKKTLILIETLRKGQEVIGAAISLNASYFAVLRRVHKEGRGDGKLVFRATVKRKPTKADWMSFFGHGTD